MAEQAWSLAQEIERVKKAVRQHFDEPNHRCRDCSAPLPARIVRLDLSEHGSEVEKVHPVPETIGWQSVNLKESLGGKDKKMIFCPGCAKKRNLPKP